MNDALDDKTDWHKKYLSLKDELCAVEKEREALKKELDQERIES